MIPISRPIIGVEEKRMVMKVLGSGCLVNGPMTEDLEEAFAKICRTKYAVAVNNGTAALHSALHVIGICSGDEVITTPFSFVATANAIIMAGATPVFVDIDERSFNIDPVRIEKAITSKTKAILAVDLYGQPADYDEINRIAKKHNLIVIEDAAQSLGASYNLNITGSLADIACFSLYATKNITCGEGGMITTNSKQYYERAKLFRNHGQTDKKRYEYVELGYNYRLTEMQAALVLAQLKRLDWILKKRKKYAQEYIAAFAQVRGIRTSFIGPKISHAFHQFTIRVTKDFPMTRDELQKHLLSKGIQSMVYYPKSLYDVHHLQSGKVDRNDFLVVECMVKEVLSIPVHPMLLRKELEYIIHTIKTL